MFVTPVLLQPLWILTRPSHVHILLPVELWWWTPTKMEVLGFKWGLNWRFQPALLLVLHWLDCFARTDTKTFDSTISWTYSYMSEYVPPMSYTSDCDGTSSDHIHLLKNRMRLLPPGSRVWRSSLSWNVPLSNASVRTGRASGGD